MTDVQEAYDFLCEQPPVTWDKWVAARQKSEAGAVGLYEMESALDSLAIAAVSASVYLMRRNIGTTHEAAVREMNRARAQVRKALGYSMADNLVI